MFLFRFFHDDYKRKKRENLILSEKINKIKPKYFLFLRNNILNENNYEDLNNEKKILFSNEDEYMNIKTKFDEIYYFRNYNKFILFCLSVLFVKRLFASNAEINLNTKLIREEKKIILKKIINHKYSKYLLSFFVIYSLNKITNNIFEYDFASKISVNSRFGIYIWFENNLRLGKLDHTTINYLDKYMDDFSYLIIKNNKNNNNFNKIIYDHLIFYQIIKIHFLEIFLAKTILKIYLPINLYKKTFEIDDKFLKRILEDFYKVLNKERYYDIKNGIEEDKRLHKIILSYILPKDISNVIFNNNYRIDDLFQLNENEEENIISKDYLEVIVENYKTLFNLKDEINNI
jgi:hypothetical protein